ncbi:MAG: N-acyl-D-amino-acid deacylase family protein, partial [Vicinamibacteria bacterium]
DGTGTPGFDADVGIRGDSIVAVGDLSSSTALKTIDATGLVVSPGFIDMHTHCESGFEKVDSNANLNYLLQGVTTVVTGNDGSGTFKVAETKSSWEELGIGTNAVHLVGFGAVREEVMGVEPRQPTAEEVERMRSLVRRAMEEGAWGMSSGLEYVPGRYATTEEIIAVAKVVGEFGGVYSSHQRNEFDGVPEATRETIRIAEEAGVRGNSTHIKVCRKNYWGVMKEAVQLINDARARGVDVFADMYPYHFASGGTIIPMERNSGWAPFHLPDDMEPFAELRKKLNDEDLPDSERSQLRERYIDELAKALSDESKRERIRQAVLFGSPHRPSAVALAGWDSYLVVVAQKNADLVGQILSDIAEEQGRDPFDVAAELVIDEPDLYVACGVMSEDDMKLAMKQDWLMFSSDGGAWPIVEEADEPRITHPRSFGSQARVLSTYVREQKVLTLENAIRKMTSLPAQFLRMADRGLIRPGYKADIVVFDPETIRENATHADAAQYSIGTKHVILAGKMGIENGLYNGSLQGKLLTPTEN